MRRKAVFLDVDGTLVTSGGQVPASARRAVGEARANGHAVFLCTGRSAPELWPELLEIGFDGRVTAAGAHVRVGTQVLRSRSIPGAEVTRAREFFAARGVAHYFESETAVFADRNTQAALRQVLRVGAADDAELDQLERGAFAFVDAIELDTDPATAEVTKIIYFDSPLPLASVRAEFAGVFEIIVSSVELFGGHSGEMSLPGVHKAAGLADVIAHLGIDRADTFALGDSFNDLEMLAQAGIGIAMDTAPQQLKDVADELTAAPEDDGVWAAFVRHGLIAG